MELSYMWSSCVYSFIQERQCGVRPVGIHYGLSAQTQNREIFLNTEGTRQLCCGLALRITFLFESFFPNMKWKWFICQRSWSRENEAGTIPVVCWPLLDIKVGKTPSLPWTRESFSLPTTEADILPTLREQVTQVSPYALLAESCFPSPSASLFSSLPANINSLFLILLEPCACCASPIYLSVPRHFWPVVTREGAVVQ